MEKNSELIRIALAPNDKFVKYALVLMISVLENTSSNVEFIILHSNLNAESKVYLNSVSKYSNARVTYAQVDENVFTGFQNASWTTIQAWFRALIPDIFPEIDKVIYLDCDTMLVSNIKQLWDIDVSDKVAAVVQDVLYSDQLCKQLSLKSNVYFNSGMLVLNCKKWREMNLFEKVKDCAMNNKAIKYGDQDVLNFVIDTDKIVISPKFNYMENWWRDYSHDYKDEFKTDYEECRKGNAVVVHFAGYKPLNAKTRNSYKDLWWQYAKKTPFYLELLEQYTADFEEYIKLILSKVKVVLI